VFAGLTAPGLYQFNIVLPASLSDGDATVVATIANALTQSNAAIPVQH
jgi:uncharacterized protein (TIGR03437 family)